MFCLIDRLHFCSNFIQIELLHWLYHLTHATYTRKVSNERQHATENQSGFSFTQSKTKCQFANSVQCIHTHEQ